MIKSPLFLLAILSLLFAGPTQAAEVNFFPPAAEAKSVDDFDATGFTIDGQRTFLASGSFHYPRAPRALWRDRLLRLKRAGFNTVQTYVFCNYHEPTEDSFDFTGEKDLEAFLKTAQDLGLYATVRVGPYVCAEWNSGGYPVWLRFKPGVKVRQHNPAYEDFQEKWMAKILPMVAAHQINKGGNVIFVQLENEGAFWGAWTPDKPNNDPYWQGLYRDAQTYGIQVPFFMSGMHHGTVPLPNDSNSADRVNPWYATEVWSSWYDIYGMREDCYLQTLDFMTKALALGANGFNYYMAYGGTNFDYWNNNEDASTYDYGAAIGQAGDLRAIYYAMKKYNTLATSFPDILETATGDLGDFKTLVTHGYVAGVRKSPNGTLVFVQGSASLNQPVGIQGVGDGVGGTINLKNLEMAGILLDTPLVPDPNSIKIIEAVTPVLGLTHDGNTTTLVVYGKAGDTGVITLCLGGVKKQEQISYPDGVPAETFEKVGNQSLRILAISSDLVANTWIVGPRGRQSVVVGPEYVGEFEDKDGKPFMTIERPFGHEAPSEVLVYGEAGVPAAHLAVMADRSIDTAPAPDLAPWQVSPPPAWLQPNFNSSSWLASDDPQQMGADGDITCYAWYQASVQAPAAGSGTIHFAGAADNMLVYVNGKRFDATPSEQIARHLVDNPTLRDGNLSWDATADFQAGANTIAVFVSHDGRDKAFGYSGPLANYYPKGIFKPVTVNLGGQSIDVKGWKMHGGIPAPAKVSFNPLDPDYTPSAPEFFQTTFTAKPPAAIGANLIFRFACDGLSRGSIFLNGHNLGRYPDTVKTNGRPLPIYLPECWLDPAGKNSLVVFDEEGKSPAQAKLQVETASSREIIQVSQPADPAVPFTAPIVSTFNLKDAAHIDAETDKPASASSNEPNSPPYFVNDGQEDTFWYPAGVPTADHPEWIAIDLGAAQSFKSFEIGWNCPASHVTYHLEGSLDNSTWTTLADEHGGEADKKDDWKTVSVPDGTSARYIRLTITGVNHEEKVGVNTLRTHS